MKNVSCFAKVEIVIIKNCREVTDVSPLCNIHSLNVRGCKNIIDFYCLKNITNLVIDDDIEIKREEFDNIVSFC